MHTFLWESREITLLVLLKKSHFTPGMLFYLDQLGEIGSFFMAQLMLSNGTIVFHVRVVEKLCFRCSGGEHREARPQRLQQNLSVLRLEPIREDIY